MKNRAMNNPKDVTAKGQKGSHIDRDLAAINTMNLNVNESKQQKDQGKHNKPDKTHKERDMKEIDQRKQVAESKAAVSKPGLDTGNDIIDNG